MEEPKQQATKKYDDDSIVLLAWCTFGSAAHAVDTCMVDPNGPRIYTKLGTWARLLVTVILRSIVRGCNSTTSTRYVQKGSEEEEQTKRFV